MRAFCRYTSLFLAGGLTAALAFSGAEAAKLHKAIGTAIDWTGTVTPVSAGTTVIDSATVNCAKTTGCIIGIASMVQVMVNSGSGSWSICVLVDGNQAAPGCPVQGTVPSSNYVVGNLRANVVVASGSHTVQTEIMMPSAGSYAAFESDITVYSK